MASLCDDVVEEQLNQFLNHFTETNLPKEPVRKRIGLLHYCLFVNPGLMFLFAMSVSLIRHTHHQTCSNYNSSCSCTTVWLIFLNSYCTVQFVLNSSVSCNWNRIWTMTVMRAVPSWCGTRCNPPSSWIMLFAAKIWTARLTCKIITRQNRINAFWFGYTKIWPFYSTVDRDRHDIWWVLLILQGERLIYACHSTETFKAHLSVLEYRWVYQSG